MPARVPNKKKTLQAFLQRGVAMVHVDARRPGVAVPAQFVGEPHLRLNLSYRYYIPDLDLDDERVQATLSFGGQPFQCILPWQAVFAITSGSSGDGQVWPEDLPVEVTQTMASQGGKGEGGKADGREPEGGKPSRSAGGKPARADSLAKAPPGLVPVRATRPTLAAVSEEPESAEPGSTEPAPVPVPENAREDAPAGPKSPDEPPKRHLRLVR